MAITGAGQAKSNIVRGVSPQPAVAGRLAERHNRMAEAMRAAIQRQHEAEMARLGSATQLATTRMGTESREKIAAMQTEAMDRALAERERASREDRALREKLQESNQAFQAEQARLEREYNDAQSTKDWQRVNEIEQNRQALERARQLVEAQIAHDTMTYGIKQLRRLRKGQTATEKIKTALIDSGKEAEQAQVMQKRAEENARASFEHLNLFKGQVWGDELEKAFNDAASRMQLPLTMKLITDEAALQRHVAEGRVSSGDILKAKAIIEALKTKAQEELTELEGKPQEETRILPRTGVRERLLSALGFEKAALIPLVPPRKKITMPTSEGMKTKALNYGVQQLIKMENTLDKLKNSTLPIRRKGAETGETVGSLVGHAINVADGVTPQAEWNALAQAMGGGEDGWDAILDDLMNTRKVFGIIPDSKMENESPGVQKFLQQHNQGLYSIFGEE